MIRRPPRSTLSFPTRRSSDLQAVEVPGATVVKYTIKRDGTLDDISTEQTSGYSSLDLNARRAVRSEEHTSELQSPCNLVCRLLLEKKKKNQTESHDRLLTPPY